MYEKMEDMREVLHAQAKAAAKARREASEQEKDGSTASGPKSIECVRALCTGEGFPIFQRENVPETHPVFTKGALAPITRLVGLPLRIHRLDPRPSMEIPRDPYYDNQRATYLMIEPDSGLAPPIWQQGVGSVIIARNDRKPLPVQHVEAMWMFASNLLAKYGDGPGAVRPNVDITREAFDTFYEEYDYQNVTRSEWVDPPVVSPYAM